MIKQKQPSLLFCLVMDAIGFATYFFPVAGEFADAIWAPVSGFIFFVVFRGWTGAAGGMFNFTEEILPGTDFIPSFTIMWLLQRASKRKQAIRIPGNYF